MPDNCQYEDCVRHHDIAMCIPGMYRLTRADSLCLVVGSGAHTRTHVKKVSRSRHVVRLSYTNRIERLLLPLHQPVAPVQRTRTTPTAPASKPAGEQLLQARVRV